MQRNTTLAIAALSLAGSACANPYGFYVDENDQRWGRTQMPDFDQKRAAIFQVPGLPNDGRMYCVPTATMNAFAYIARHGYPSIDPGSANWDPDNNDQYEDITLHLQDLGWLMGTSPTDGTTAQGWYDGARAWLPHNQFDVYQRLAFSNDDCTTREIADIGRAGGLIMLCYGRWEHDNYALTDRTGGHCVTATEVDVDFPFTSTVKYRNPSSSDSDFFQSNFSYTTIDALDLWYTLDGQPYKVSRLEFDIDDPDDDRVRLIDFLGVIFPKNGLTNWPTGSISSFLPNPADPGNPTIDTFAMPAGVTPGVCELNPGRTLFAMIGENTQSTDSERGVYLKYELDNTTIEPEAQLDIVGNPIGLTFCRRSYLNVLTERELIQFDLDDEDMDPAASADTNGYANVREVGRMTLPPEPKDLFYDDMTDQIVVLTREHILLARHDMAATETRSVPTELIAMDLRSVVVCPTTGNLVALGTEPTSGATNMNELVWDPALARYSVGASHTFAAGDTVSSLSVDDGQRVYVVLNQANAAYSIDPATGAFSPDPTAPFAGQPAGSSFRISRSRTNYDARIHATPGWNTNIDPDELAAAPETTDCEADFNLDGLADINDLLAFLAAWFAGDDIADVNVDTEIDINDLLQFLAAWFNGCP